jgi:hypothetical protein
MALIVLTDASGAGETTLAKAVQSQAHGFDDEPLAKPAK